MISRRTFLQLSSLALVSFVSSCTQVADIFEDDFAVEVFDDKYQESMERAQRLSPKAQSQHRAEILIVGGGLSALLVARELERLGFSDYCLLAPDKLGGTCRYNLQVGQYSPEGASRLPLTHPDNEQELELLQELGIIRGFSPQGQAIYRDEFLCSSPQARIYKNGGWRPGLFPGWNATRKELKQALDFDNWLEQLSNMRDKQGRPWFASPLVNCSSQSQYLWGLSVKELLHKHNWTSPSLLAFAQANLRRSRLSDPETCPAFPFLYALIREQIRATHPQELFLTWPKGLAQILSPLQEKVASRYYNQRLVYKVTETPDSAQALALSGENLQKVEVWRAKHIVVALPNAMRRLLGHKLVSPDEQIQATFTVQAENLNFEADDYPLSYCNSCVDSSLGEYFWPGVQSLKSSPDKNQLLVIPRCFEENDCRTLENLEEEMDLILQQLKIVHYAASEAKYRSCNIHVFSGLKASPDLAQRPQPELSQDSSRLHWASADMASIPCFSESLYYASKAAREVAKALS